MAEFRVFGYIRSSVDRQIEKPEVQEEIIRRYCRRVGLELTGVCVDPHASGKLPISQRKGGGWLSGNLRRGDHVILARLDRLADSFHEAALTLNNWHTWGFTVHLLDLPGGRLDAGSQHSRLVIAAVLSFATAERRMIGIRVRESFAGLATEGRRRSRHAPIGFRWKKRGGKTYAEPDLAEQASASRCPSYGTTRITP